MKHHKKYHANESVYTCSECGKGFITSDGHRRHMDGHNIAKCLKCTFPDCTKTFTSHSNAQGPLQKCPYGERTTGRMQVQRQRMYEGFQHQGEYDRTHVQMPKKPRYEGTEVRPLWSRGFLFAEKSFTP